MLNLSAVPGVGAVTLLHEAFVPFATGVGSLGGEVCRCNGLPIEAFLARVHQLIVIGGVPRARGLALGRGRRGFGHGSSRVVRFWTVSSRRRGSWFGGLGHLLIGNGGEKYGGERKGSGGKEDET